MFFSNVVLQRSRYNPIHNLGFGCSLPIRRIKQACIWVGNEWSWSKITHHLDTQWHTYKHFDGSLQVEQTWYTFCITLLLVVCCRIWGKIMAHPCLDNWICQTKMINIIIYIFSWSCQEWPHLSFFHFSFIFFQI